MLYAAGQTDEVRPPPAHTRHTHRRRHSAPRATHEQHACAVRVFGESNSLATCPRFSLSPLSLSTLSLSTLLYSTLSLLSTLLYSLSHLSLSLSTLSLYSLSLYSLSLSLSQVKGTGVWSFFEMKRDEKKESDEESDKSKKE